MAITPGRHIGNFEVVRLLGSGGFGEVHEAVNPLLNRRVAIKVLHGRLIEDAQLVRRFLNEARAATAIHHPNIVEVFDAGMTPEREPYIVMEYLEGSSLHKVIAERDRLPWSIVREIARQTCSALAAAHAADIVHRDLKPENLFVIPRPGFRPDLQVKILDFGIAKVKHAGQSTVKTRAGLVMGSPAYMSPEQCKDSSDVDHRTDIYSMGVIVYEMLAGVPPFSAASAADLLVMQITSAPPALRLRVPDVPEHVEQAVMRALAKDRAARYDGIDDFLEALLGDQATLVPRGSPPTVRVAAPVREAASGGRRPAPTGQPSPASTAVLPDGEAGSATSAPPKPPTRPITTFALASGESTDAAPGPTTGSQSPATLPRTWRWLVAAGAAALALTVGLGIVLLKRRSPADSVRPTLGTHLADEAAGRPPKPARVRLRVHSSPSGASVLDGDSLLGRTPLETFFPKGSGSVRLTLRLAGHDDETVTLGRDADASALVRLRPVRAATGGQAEASAVAPATSKAKPIRLRPRPRATPPSDDLWIAH